MSVDTVGYPPLFPLVEVDGFDPFRYRVEKWLRAWRGVWHPEANQYRWDTVYDGLFTNNGVVRTYTRSPAPPYYIVQVWEREPNGSWRLTFTKANWQKGVVLT